MFSDQRDLSKNQRIYLLIYFIFYSQGIIMTKIITMHFITQSDNIIKINIYECPFIIIMKSALGKFPYEDAQEVMYFQDMKGDNYKTYQQSEVELYRRFPWLQFKKDQLKKKYIYLGRDTEKSHPFYIRFNISQEGEDSTSQLSQVISKTISVIVEGVINFSMDSELKKKVEKMQQVIDQNTLFPISHFSVHHGYLLTGIAKPNIRYNQIYDSLFLEALRTKTVIEKGTNEREGVFNLMKLSWDYKHHSYEYFMFMSRAYMLIRNKLNQQKLPQDQIDDLTQMELFNYSQARSVIYWDKNGKKKQIRDMDYFQYFSTLFKYYSEDILQLQPVNQSYPRKYILMLGQKEHHLYEYDFKTYFQNQFKGKQLSSESLQRMVKHNHQRNNKIIHSFPVKTCYQRISKLKKLVNQNKHIYHRIRLIPLTQTNASSHSSHQDQNFLIMFMRDQEDNVANTYCLKDIIEKLIIKQEQSVRKSTGAENHKMQRESMYHSLYRYEQWGKEYSLLNHISFDPKKLTWQEDGIISPTFQYAMISMLGLDQLPLTLEQQLLACTPTAQIDIYEQLQKLVREYQNVRKEKNTLEEFCWLLSDEKEDGLRLFYQQNLQQINIEEKEQQWKAKTSQIGFKLLVLQMSMIDFQGNRTRCLYPQKGSGQPYNAFTPAHYKQLQQYLIILLIETCIITDIQYTKKESTSANIDRIKMMKKNYQTNWSQYKKYKGYNVNRQYFRQLDQQTFRNNICSLFQNLQSTSIIQRGLRQMMRIMLKSFIAIQFLQTRVVVIKINDDSKEESHKLLVSQYLQSLEVFRKTVENISKQEKKEGTRTDFSDSKWKAMDQTSFYKERKAAISTIHRQFTSFKEILKQGPLSSETKNIMGKEDIASIQRKITAIKQSNLVVLCSVYNDLVKLQDKDLNKMAILYKVLLCFCCHFNQFHKNELLGYQISNVYTEQTLTAKIYKLKNVMVTELVRYISKYKERYFT